MKLVSILSIVTFSLGCASMPGGVTSSTSSYDGAKIVSMKPGWATLTEGGAALKVGARHSSTMDADTAVLTVRLDVIRNFSSERPNLFIKVDQAETKLSPIFPNTECNISSSTDVAHCFQEYKVPMSLIQQMTTATTVRFRLLMRDNAYVEGGLDGKGPTTAHKGLTEFLSKVKSN